MKAKLNKLLILLAFSFNGYSQDTTEQIGFTIPNTGPPKVYYELKEGSCGEACLSTIFDMQGKPMSQEKINKAGGNPGRGLYGDEIIKVLKEKEITYKDISINTRNISVYLYKRIIPSIKANNPVLLGVTVYPTEHPEWLLDHFILLVGYDSSTNEIIYNSFDRQDRILVEKILNKKKGYSIVTKHREIYAIQFAYCDTCELFAQFEDHTYRAKGSVEIESSSDTVINRIYDKRGRIWIDVYYVHNKNVFSRIYSYEKDGAYSFSTFPTGFFKKRDGLTTIYYKGGTIWTELLYKNGRPWTVLSRFDNEDNVIKKGTLTNGSGTRYFYTSDGELIRTLEYKDGKKVKKINAS